MTVVKFHAWFIDKTFDLRRGIKTNGVLELSTLTIDSENINCGSKYEPVRVVPLKRLLATIKHLIPPDSALVDFGCGMGRVLFIAAEFGFKKIRGIEFAHELCNVAKSNIKSYNSIVGNSLEFEIIEGDVVNYSIQADESVFFLFNPFNELILNQVICNIINSINMNPRVVLIVYQNPKHGNILNDSSFFAKLLDFDYLSREFSIYSNRLQR